MTDLNIPELEHAVFPGGTLIFDDGDKGDIAYIVIDGMVEISKAAGGERVILGVVEDGGMFGEMALLDSTERMARARAMVKTECVVLPRELFAKEMAKTDAFMYTVVRALLSYVRSLTSRVVENMEASK